jgi:hypothetical protein
MLMAVSAAVRLLSGGGEAVAVHFRTTPHLLAAGERNPYVRESEE